MLVYGQQDDFVFILAGCAEDAFIVLCWASLLEDTAVVHQCLGPLRADLARTLRGRKGLSGTH